MRDWRRRGCCGGRARQIKLVAAPTYVMTAHSLDRQSGIELMDLALAKMTEVVKAKGGDLIVKLKVRVCTACCAEAWAAGGY